MKKLIYEDVNLQTGFSYSIYRFYSVYQVLECNQDGDSKCIEEFTSCDDAVAFVRNKCK